MKIIKRKILPLIAVLITAQFSLFCNLTERDNPNDPLAGNYTHGNGTLIYVDKYSSTNIDGAYSVALSTDGNHVYVTAANADAVAWFTRDY